MGANSKERRIYHPDDAEQFYIKNAGKPYRPSNGTEGEIFHSAWCSDCTKDAATRTGDFMNGCPIIANSMAYDRNHPSYPKEWVYGDDGQPKCTAFEGEAQTSPNRPEEK